MGVYDVIPLADVDISWEAGFFSRTQKRLEDNRRFAVTYSGIPDQVECDKYDSSYELLFLLCDQNMSGYKHITC